MASASSSAGVRGKWGDTRYVPLRQIDHHSGPIGVNTPAKVKPAKKKFFSSKNDPSKTPMKTSTKVGGGNIAVCVRLRPALDGDLEDREEFVHVSPGEGNIFVTSEKCFHFDIVFDGARRQEDFYLESGISQAVADSVAEVRHTSVFAYGQTGTGKTYTMGTEWNNEKERQDEDRKGVIPRAIAQIFRQIRLAEMERSQQSESTDDLGNSENLSVRMSFFEIHNEKIFDLLKAAKMKVPLKLKEEGHEFHIPDLTQHLVTSEAEAIALLDQGRQTRSTGATSQNAHSSRSHAVLRLSLISQARDEVNDEVTVRERRISLVDLAGSESAGSSKNELRRVEGVNINKGLSVLGRCISSICDGDKHIPFRDSILTKVLRDSLVGHESKTIMIACISPAEDDLRETMNTLRYADCVKRMVKPAIPEHLANLVKSSTKRRLQALIPPTPAQNRKRPMMNNTIETPTPSKVKAKARGHLQGLPAMNATIGTPFRTPGKTMKTGRHNYPPMLSSSVSKAPSLDTICDEGQNDTPDTSLSNTSYISGISSIHPAQSGNVFAPQQLNFGVNSSMAQANNADVSAIATRSVLSPIMRELREDLKRQLGDIAESMKSTLEASILATVQKKKRAHRSSRMTSSPTRRSPRISAARNSGGVLDAVPSPVLAEESLNESGEETIHAGPAFHMGREKMRNRVLEDTADQILSKVEATLPRALGDVTNKRSNHLKKIEATASPTFGPKTPKGPSIEDMEKALGINPDSPLMFEQPSTNKENSFARPSSNPRSSVRRTARRTTMLQPELNKSIRQSMKMDLRPKKEMRRSVRISNLKQKEETKSPGKLKHPLQENKAWRVKNQNEHNSNLLTILNTANMGMLQKLPGIGPKSAIIIHSQRELRNGYECLEDLRTIPGLQKNFFEKFCSKNQIQI